MRQFVSETALDSDGCIRIGGEKFHYLSAVLRLVPGDMLYVRLPDGELQQMTVARVDASDRTMLLSLAGTDARNRPASVSSAKAAPIEKSCCFHFHLFQCIPKPPKFDLIIRQATECGVSTILPVAGEFCQKGNVESAVRKSSPQDTRWGKIITEAREQSGSPVQTEVLPCRDFAAACELWKNGTLGNSPVRMAFVLYERTEGTLPIHRAVAAALTVAAAFPGVQQTEPLKSGPETADIAVMVGAEGGISPSELEKAKEAGFIPVHLETNILRCETAALYGLATLQNAVMESDIWKLKE